MGNFASLVLRLLAALLFASLGAVPAAGRVAGIDAVYNIGDSLSDTGNLIREGNIGTFEPIKHLPYGETIGHPTGRCSDGLLMIDYLVRDLGLPLLNPYLAKNASFTQGVNFAVAGATALNTSDLAMRGIFDPYTNSSLSVQLGWFKDFIASNQDALDKLQSSLIMVGEIGGNDYNYAIFSNKPMNEVQNLIPDVVQAIVHAAKEILDMGATRMIIPGNFPIGCMPSYLALAGTTNPFAYDDKQCLTGLNAFAREHNKQVREAIQQLRFLYPQAQIAYADYYGAFMELLSISAELGFDVTSLHQACCGADNTYNFDPTKMCGYEGTSVCVNPDQHISWDGIHLTQHAYKVLAYLLYHGGFAYPNMLNFTH